MRALRPLSSFEPAARVATIYLVAVALPFSWWASPVDNRRQVLLFAVSLVAFLAAAALARRHPLLSARAYFALGCGFGFAHQRFPPNELAGTMLLFAPLAAVLATSPRGSISPIHRVQAALLALLFGGLLIASGSRGGLVSVALAAAAVVGMLSLRRLALLAVLAGAVLAATSGHWLDWLIYDGQNQGFTLGVLLTGRPEIWWTSLLALSDFSLIGVGVGSFGRVVPALYAPGVGERWEDAHSLPLQTALDLGVPGLLAALILVALAYLRLVRHLRRSGAPEAGGTSGIPEAGGTSGERHLRRSGALEAGGTSGIPEAGGTSGGPVSEAGGTSGGTSGGSTSGGPVSEAGGTSQPTLALGLFAALLAFSLFNLADAVALATPGGLAFALLLGLIFALPAPAPLPPALPLPAGRLGVARGVVTGAIVLAGAAVLLWPRLPLQLAARGGARALLGEPSAIASAREELERAAGRSCRAHWLLGRLAAAQGDGAGRDRAWARALRCSGDFVRPMAAELPTHRGLAELAAGIRPEDSDALFWLAWLEAKAGRPGAAIPLYRRGLARRPGDGLAWLELGRLLHPRNPWAALFAYAAACRNGDPGANACGAAGHLARELSGPREAAVYFQRSRWPPVRRLAAES